MSTSLRLWVLSGLLGLGFAAQAATASFDDLSALPDTDGQSGLFFANGQSLYYAGVLWDERFRVVGDTYRVDPGPPPGPLYGIPHSGHYFVTNEGDGVLNDHADHYDHAAHRRLVRTQRILRLRCWC